MSNPAEQRTSERIPTRNRVKVIAQGKLVAYSLAVNLSLGGVLLDAAPVLPVGSRCELALFTSGTHAARGILTAGTVVRSDAQGTAIQFLETLAPGNFQALARQSEMSRLRSIFNAYGAYYRVGQSDRYADCERLLGVSKRTYRTVFLTSFSACIPLAILPVWLLKDSLPPAPVWAKISAAFLYGATWLLLIQPTIDLTAFRFLRQKQAPGPKN